MTKIKSKDTKPELIFRKALRKNNLLGYKIKTKLIGKPDIVFTKYKIAIFIDGCFWHRCRYHYKQPKSRLDYWIPKIERNVKRRITIKKILKKEGWKVMRIWEHSIKKDADKYILKIKSEINKAEY